MYVKPVEHTVLDPHTLAPVPAEGAEVPPTAYWLRRLRDGDLVETEAPKPTEAAPLAVTEEH